MDSALFGIRSPRGRLGAAAYRSAHVTSQFAAFSLLEGLTLLQRIKESLLVQSRKKICDMANSVCSALRKTGLICGFRTHQAVDNGFGDGLLQLCTDVCNVS